MKKSELLLTKEEFIETIKVIEHFRELQQEFNTALRHIDDGCYAFIFAPYEDEYVWLLKRMFHNEFDEDIDYFLYDHARGKEWDPGDVVDSKGNDIKMANAEDLWNYIIGVIEFQESNTAPVPVEE